MNPFQVLGLPQDSSAADVEARWRVLRSELHPDKGGDEIAFCDANRAYEKALAIASEPKPCDNCGGSGKTSVTRGFNQVKLVCRVCNGTGQKP